MSTLLISDEYNKLVKIMGDILDMKKKMIFNDENNNCIKLMKEEGKGNTASARQRRVTPVPNDTINEILKNSFKRTKSYISVEEEDEDDLECYDKEIDYVNPDLLSCEKVKSLKRNSWHGEYSDRSNSNEKKTQRVGLSKSNSLDRGIDAKRYRRKNNCGIKPILQANEMKTSSPSNIQPGNCEEDLPEWMKNACLEDVGVFVENNTENEMKYEPTNDNTTRRSIVSNLFDIQETFQEKERKEKKQYSERRKELQRQKNICDKRKQRKITPSGSEIKKFSSFRNSNSFDNVIIQETLEEE